MALLARIESSGGEPAPISTVFACSSLFTCTKKAQMKRMCISSLLCLQCFQGLVLTPSRRPQQHPWKLSSFLSHTGINTWSFSAFASGPALSFGQGFACLMMSLHAENASSAMAEARFCPADRAALTSALLLLLWCEITVRKFSSHIFQPEGLSSHEVVSDSCIV